MSIDWPVKLPRCPDCLSPNMRETGRKRGTYYSCERQGVVLWYMLSARCEACGRDACFSRDEIVKDFTVVSLGLVFPGARQPTPEP